MLDTLLESFVFRQSTLYSVEAAHDIHVEKKFRRSEGPSAEPSRSINAVDVALIQVLMNHHEAATVSSLQNSCCTFTRPLHRLGKRLTSRI